MDLAGLVVLPDGPTAPAVARRMVRECLDGWGVEDVLDPVLLLVSELVTNAVLHATGPVRLGVARNGAGVRVQVADASPVLPVRRRSSASATTGRGIALLDDLADAWGVDRPGTGKVLWFTLSATSSAWDGTDLEALLSEAEL